MSLQEFLEKVVEMKGYVLGCLTDRLIVDSWPMKHFALEEINEKNLLELRVFNKNKEWKLIRSDVSKAFSARLIDDSKSDSNKEWYDEVQRLDIDSTRTQNDPESGYTVWTTGGGQYHLPLEASEDGKNGVIRIRYYLTFPFRPQCSILPALPP